MWTTRNVDSLPPSRSVTPCRTPPQDAVPAGSGGGSGLRLLTWRISSNGKLVPADKVSATRSKSSSTSHPRSRAAPQARGRGKGQGSAGWRLLPDQTRTFRELLGQFRCRSVPMAPLYAARIADLGAGDLVQIECACGHVTLMTAPMLATASVAAEQKLIDLSDPRTAHWQSQFWDIQRIFTVHHRWTMRNCNSPVQKLMHISMGALCGPYRMAMVPCGRVPLAEGLRRHARKRCLPHEKK
jgi:hypothetical protein